MAIRGPRGPAGVAGPRGVAGPTGANGPKWNRWYTDRCHRSYSKFKLLTNYA